MTLKSQTFSFFLCHTAAVFEDCPPWVRSHNKLSCALVLGGPFRQGRVGLGRQVPIPGIAACGSLSLCSSEMWQSEIGSSGNLRVWCLLTAAWWKDAPFVWSLWDSPSAAIRISRHISCSEKSEKERSFTKGNACQAQILLWFCAENKHRCEG